MATLGYTTAGASTARIDGQIRGTRQTMSENGLPTSIAAYVETFDFNKSMKAAIYQYDSGGSHTLIAESEAVTIVADIGPAWTHFHFDTCVQLLSGVEYIFCVWSSTTGGGFSYVYYDASGSGINKTVAFGAWPSPLSSVTSNTEKHSIFLFYIPGSATGSWVGETTRLTSTLSIEDQIVGPIKTMAAVNATLNAIVAYIDFAAFGASDTVLLKAALYTNAADPVLLAQSNELSVDPYTASTPGTTLMDGWRVFPFASPPALTASTAYTICVWSTAESGTVSLRTLASGGSGVETQGLTYGSWPDPMVNTLLASRNASVFMDYTQSSSVRMLASTGVGK